MRENPPFISVVVPAYNEAQYLGKCLAALRDQDYPHDRYEVIVVDNASTDDTAGVAASFGVQVIKEPRKGVAYARQRGAEAGRGEVIAGLDADSVAPQGWLSGIGRHFQEDPGLGAATGPVYIYDSMPWKRWAAALVNDTAMRLTYILGRGWLVGHNFAVRKSVLMSIGGFNTSLLSAEDLDLAVRLQMVTRMAYDAKIMMYISSRRLREGYDTVISRSAANYIRVVFLKQPPYSGYQVEIR